MLSLNNISVYFGADPLFEEVSFRINPKERVALAGRNGAGKTTLLNIIAGMRQPSQGSVSMPSGASIGYLPQHLLTKDTKTVREDVRTAFHKELEIKKTLDRLNNELLTRTDYETESYMELVQRVANYTDLLSAYSPERQEAEIEKTLKGLGFDREDFDRPTSVFSGGWRMRIELAKILLGRPDLLLLDEPTNHLDVESIVWLENYVKTTPAAVIMVSHDRAFLDNTTTRTIELTLGHAVDYKVPYTHYLELRDERYEQQKRAYEAQQKEIQRTEDFIERFRYKATKAVQVQSRIKQLERMDRLEIEELDKRKIHFSFPMAIPSGSYPLTVEDLHVSYGDHEVLKGVDLIVERGEKIAITGKNGTGKTTFVRAVMQEIEHQGKLKLGHQVIVSYFAQNEVALLDPNKTIFETIDDLAVGEIRNKINDLLGAFMFGGELSEKKVSVLSGGEKSRLAIITFLLKPSNFLILDEPTNHLDIASKEVLKGAISRYEGTVLIISHDRNFLSGLVDRVVEFHDGHAIAYEDMPDYLRALEARTNEANTLPGTNSSDSEDPAKAPTEGRLDYEAQKERNKQEKRLQQEIEKLETQITAHEKEQQELEATFAQGKTSEEALKRYNELVQNTEELMRQWEKKQEEMTIF